MPWLIGLDEAGYGPNLGPLLQTAVTVHVPEREPSLWERLSGVIRRADDENDGRVLIDDSKRVHDGPHGFRKLEASVLSLLVSSRESLCRRWEEFLHGILIGTSRDDLAAEEWFNPDETLPLSCAEDELTTLAEQLRAAKTLQNVKLGPIFSLMVPAPRFNALLDQHQLKSVILAEGVIAFCTQARQLPGDDPLIFAVDKLGGRHFYTGLLQAAFPDGWVRTLREGPSECHYQILGLEREIHLYFQPRADSAHMTVAIASMVSKYLREVCMLQFNRWWAQRIPGIKPTAGYPTDATRFMAVIRPKLKEFGLEESRIWRRK
jgi:hypothetical protein